MIDDAPRRARPRPPNPEAFRSWIDMRTRNRDTDQFGHVNHAAMATMFEESRIALVFDSDMAAETAGLDLIVASLQMDFHLELSAPGEIRVGAAVKRIGSSSFDVRQAIFVGGTCHASAEAVCVMFGSESRRPVPMSKAMREHLLGAPAL